jgi:phage terminase small subunit
MNRLTTKQREFVDAYVNNGGNGVDAVINAGYTCKNENVARVQASDNLKKPNIILAIEEAGYKDSRIVDMKAIERGRRLDLAERRISTREDRAEFLTGIYLDEAFPIGSRLQAVQLLGKMYGDYLDRVVLQKEEVQMPVINICLDN